jgi:CxxC-x17-CxxC domain-containing protein
MSRRGVVPRRTTSWRRVAASGDGRADTCRAGPDACKAGAGDVVYAAGQVQFHRCAPKQGSDKRHLGSRGPGSLSRLRSSRPPNRLSVDAPRSPGPGGARDLRRSNPQLCRLWSGVHPFGGRPGVLRPARVRLGPQAMRQLPCQPAGSPRQRVRLPRHRRPARVRAREYFAAICSSCGNQAQVPFKPRMDKPVYCSDCFRTIKPD